MSRFEREWQKHYDDFVPHSLEYPRTTMYEFLKESAEKHSGKAAVSFFGKETTYDELFVKAERFAAALSKMGVHEGDKIILLLPNCPQFIIAYLAILRLGAVVVMANPLNVERELIYKFNDCGAETIITLDVLSFRINKVKREVATLKHIIYTKLTHEMPFPINLIFPIVTRGQTPKPEIEKDDKTFIMKDMLKTTAEPPAFESLKVAPDDLAVLIYSGGTTGVSKGIMLSHYALITNAMQIRSWGEVNTDDSFLLVLPMFHGFGMSVGLNTTLSVGGRIILLPKFDPKLMLDTVKKTKPTFFAGVPTMYIALKEYSEFDKYDLSCFRGMFCGAAPLAAEVQKEFEELSGAPMIEGYGLTEIVTAISCNPMHGVRKNGTVGIPFPDIDCKIVDLETGEKEVGVGEEGELILKGPDLMLGYLNLPEETAKTLRDGWLYTGDICTKDEDGYISIVDRKKDLIIVSGFNVFPREIDEVLLQHPKVVDGVAVGLPHAKKGEFIKAYVVAKEGETLQPDELIAFCKERLTPYMVPKAVEVRDELPKSMIGKILRRTLKEEELAKNKG